MNCENTIAAGFQFMVGKFLFEAALFLAVLVFAGLIWLAVCLASRGKR